MQKFFTVLLMTALLAACGDQGKDKSAVVANAENQRSAAAAMEAETARLNEWFAARWEEQLDFSPIQKTFLGRTDDYEKIDDLSERAEAEQPAWRRRTTAEMKEAFDYDRLTAEAKMS